MSWSAFSWEHECLHDACTLLLVTLSCAGAGDCDGGKLVLDKMEAHHVDESGMVQRMPHCTLRMDLVVACQNWHVSHYARRRKGSPMPHCKHA